MRLLGSCPNCHGLDQMIVGQPLKRSVECKACGCRWVDIWLMIGDGSLGLLAVEIERGRYGVRVTHPGRIPFEDRIREVLNTVLMVAHGLSNSHAAEGGVCGVVTIDGVEEYVDLRCSSGLGLEDAVRSEDHPGVDEVLESYWLMLLMLFEEELTVACRTLRPGLILRLDEGNPDHAPLADRLLGLSLRYAGGGEEYRKLCARIPEIAVPSENRLRRMKLDDFTAYFAPAGYPVFPRRVALRWRP